MTQSNNGLTNSFSSMRRFGYLTVVALVYAVSRTVSAFTASRNERRFARLSTFDYRRECDGALLKRRNTPSLATSLRASAISPGDTVVVIGGTGGVGQLVTKKLRNGKYKVRVTSRNVERAQETIDDNEVDVVSVDLLSEDTTALKEAVDGAAALVISVGTTAFPTTKWAGGNTPKAIDEEAVKRIANVAQSVSGLKKVVLLTSVGVDRTGEMPFVILNLFGVLDAKRSGEDAIIAASAESGFDYAIIRPGRLVGGPYTNLDVAKLMQIEGGAENGVTVEGGDSLLGDCKRDAVAEAVVRCLTMDECKNVAFSIVSNEERALTTEQWSKEFSRISQ